MSGTLRFCFILFALAFFQQNKVSAQENPSFRLSYLDSLTASGLYKEALEGFQSNMTTLEESELTVSLEYLHSIRQAIYCQARLPDFTKTGALVEKILPRINEYQHLPPLDLASLYLVIGEYDYLISGDFDRALDLMKNGYGIFKDADSQSSLVARAATYLGALFTNRSEYDSSQIHLKQALSFYLEEYGPKHFLVAGVYAQMSQNELQRAQYWQSLSALKKMLAISTYEVDSTLIDEENYQGADSLELFYSDFIELSAEKKIPHKFHPIDAEVGRIMAMSFFRLGDLDMARKTIVLFQEVYEQNNSPYLVADCQNMLGNIYLLQYQYEYALSLYLKAKNTYSKLGLADAHVTVWVYENLAQTHNQLNNLDSAVYYHKKALAIRRKSYESDNSQIARSYFNLASVFDPSTQSDSSLFYLNEAIRLDYADESHSWSEKGKTFLMTGRLDSARKSFKIALNQLGEGKSDFHQATLNGMGDVYYETGNLDSAYDYYYQALLTGYPQIEEVINTSAELEIDKVDYPSHFLTSLSNNVIYYLKKYESEKDITLLERAKTLGTMSEQFISQVRGSFITENDHLRFSAEVSSVIKNTIEVNLTLYESTGNKDYLKEVFRIADLNKSQLLLEALKSSIKEKQNNSSLITEWTQLRNQLRSQRVKIRKTTLSQTHTTSLEVSQDKVYLDRLESDYAQLLKLIQETQPGLFYYVADNSSDFSISSFQKYLGKSNSIAVQYFLSEDYLYQLWLTEEDVSYSKTELEGDKLLRAVTEFYEFVSQPTTPSENAYTSYVENAYFLYTSLLAKLDQFEPDKNLIIIPDGFLTSIPFEALLTGKVKTKRPDFSELPYLITQRPVSYAFSASVLSETLRNKENSNSNTATGWAPFSDELNLDEPQQRILRDKNLSKLIGASLEIQGIVKQFKGENFLSKKASETTFKAKSEDSGIIHIATHGIVNDESPELSYLVFNKDADDSLNDGDLYLFELYDLNLKADLTILSACNTGNGKLAKGEGVLSMARAFTYSGSKSVMMSLWLANDKSTYQIIDDFYAKLANSETKSSALRKSKLAYLADADNLMSHPFYWAHIITTGNDEPLVKKPFNLAWLLILILPVIVIIMRAKKQQKT